MVIVFINGQNVLAKVPSKLLTASLPPKLWSNKLIEAVWDF